MNGKEILKNIDALWVEVDSRRDEIVCVKNVLDQTMSVIFANGKKVDELEKAVELLQWSIAANEEVETFDGNRARMDIARKSRLEVANELQKRIMSGKYCYEELEAFIRLTDGL